jgi:hypothetical protein
MTKRRAKNLDAQDIKRIVEILDGWSEKLTWDLFIDAIEMRLFNRYSRQALFKHERIRNAFELRKKNLFSRDGTDSRTLSLTQKASNDQIARLQAENARLELENNRLLEQFARWAYNARSRGLDLDFLNRPLTSVNRGQTRR